MRGIHTVSPARPNIHSTAIVDPGARLADDVTVGPLAVVDAEVVWADSERFALRSADALYTFHHGSGLALMFHHLFAPA